MNMTFIILFFIGGFNILLSQQDCYNLDFGYKSWYKKDSVVSVENISKKFEVIKNEKVIQNIKLDGDIIDLKIYDILGKMIPFEFNRNQSELNVSINDESIKNKLILITIGSINRDGIRYNTIKHYLE